MLKKYIERFRGSLTARIFMITALILFAACGVTYLFIAWATPISYQSIETDNLGEKTEQLVNKLQDVTLEDCGPLLDGFIRDTGAEVVITDEDRNIVSLPILLEEEIAYDNARSDFLTVASVAVTNSGWNLPFTFRDSDTVYELTVIASITAVNQTVEAMGRILPYLVLVVLAISLLGALFYSRYITRPIVRLSGISQRMAGLDFSWECQEKRGDEIGVLGQNLDELSRRLSAALSDLKTVNAKLQRDIDRERELERQRSAFFAAASHELKTPVTVLTGQLSGMLAGVDIYQDRDKYLARSLAVTGRMEKLVREMLTISRMERTGYEIQQAPVDLSALVREQAAQAEDLALQREQRITAAVAADLTIQGDPVLLGLAVSNLLTNALNYSPERELITVSLSVGTSGPILLIENNGVQIPQTALPHLFEAFYRAEGSRNRKTGGSGLGLYLVKMILDRHGARCEISNTGTGVRTVVWF